MGPDIIFIKKGEYEKGDAGFAETARLASLYISETTDGDAGISPEPGDIVRTELGKPYFRPEASDRAGKALPHFSISHSGDIRMSMFSDEDCGVDCQAVRPADHMKIARRFFSEAEVRFVEENGADGFFVLWTRREALGKFIGEGFFAEDMPALTELTGTYRGHAYRLTDLDIGEGYRAACCTSGHEERKVIIRWI